MDHPPIGKVTGEERLCGTNFISVNRETAPPLVRVGSEPPEFARKLQ